MARRGKPNIGPEKRQRIINLHNGKCHGCNTDLRDPEHQRFQHKTPRSAKGRDTEDNFVLLCEGCDGRTPYNIRIPNWLLNRLKIEAEDQGVKMSQLLLKILVNRREISHIVFEFKAPLEEVKQNLNETKEKLNETQEIIDKYLDAAIEAAKSVVE